MEKLKEILAADAYVKFYQDEFPISVFKKLVQMDPTVKKDLPFEKQQKGKFVDWLLKQYKKAESDQDKELLIEEDASIIREGLELFYKLSKSNQGKEFLLQEFPFLKDPADINQYDSKMIKRIYSVNDEAVDATIPAARKIKVLHNGEHLFMGIPLTHEASRKYGTGTNWCTAVSNPTWYKNYSDRGPLFIIINKKNQNKKWQYHRDDFRDRDDNSITPYGFLKEALEENNESFTKEADNIARILGEDYNYEEWSPKKLKEQRIESIAEIRNILGNVRVSELPYAKENGYSLYFYFVVIENEPVVGEILKELNPKVKGTTTDVANYLNRLNMNITSTSRVQKAFSIVSDEELYKAYLLALEMEGEDGETPRVNLNLISGDDFQLLRDLYQRLSSRPLEDRYELLMARNPFFGHSFLYLLNKKEDKGEIFLNLSLTLFPELKELEENNDSLKESSPRSSSYVLDDDFSSKEEIEKGINIIPEWGGENDSLILKIARILYKEASSYLSRYPLVVEFFSKISKKDQSDEELTEILEMALTTSANDSSFSENYVKVMRYITGKFSRRRSGKAIEDGYELTREVIYLNKHKINWRRVIDHIKEFTEERLKEGSTYNLETPLAVFSPLFMRHIISPGGKEGMTHAALLRCFQEELEGKDFGVEMKDQRNYEKILKGEWEGIAEENVTFFANEVFYPAFKELGLAKKAISEMTARLSVGSRASEVLIDMCEKALESGAPYKAVAPMEEVFSDFNTPNYIKESEAYKNSRISLFNLEAKEVFLCPNPINSKISNVAWENNSDFVYRHEPYLIYKLNREPEAFFKEKTEELYEIVHELKENKSLYPVLETTPLGAAIKYDPSRVRAPSDKLKGILPWYI